ncbi:MAG TPA: AraC family transcriptional regulator [Lapillicoccus sp.]|nr:AraC family transcriptional regulator [Lapillicoccus sp.]
MRTVRVGGRDERFTPVYAMVPAPGELPVGVWRLGHGEAVADRLGAHAHEFPLLVYSEGSTAASSALSLRAGDVLVVAPGTVMGPFDADHPEHAKGWAVSFSAEILGSDVPGSSFAWRTHPLLFPFVRGQATGTLRRSVPEPDRPDWSLRLAALAGELEDRRDGYREAAVAHLTLLLVEVSRLASDVVDDLRVNQEPLLAAVFDVIERGYAEPLSLQDVARAVSLSPGHLTTTVRQRTGRTVQDWIVDRRMVEARRLLAGSTLTVAEVGRTVGYPDAGYFTRTFRRVHGVTPTRWRLAR